MLNVLNTPSLPQLGVHGSVRIQASSKAVVGERLIEAKKPRSTHFFDSDRRPKKID